MTAVLWRDIEQDIEAAQHHFGMGIDLFPDLLARKGRARYVATMAYLHAMQSGYTLFEAGMKRLMALLNEPLPRGPEWQKDLVRRIGDPVPGARPAVLDQLILKRAVADLLGFRHVAMHVYDDFDPDRAASAMRDAEVFMSEIVPALARFRAVIDPD